MSKSVSRLFANPVHAAIYSKFRPKTPIAVASSIIKYLGQEITPPFHRALDVGCGSGQSTRILGSYFKEIIGTDVSEAQINEASKDAPPNISYKVGPAEAIPLENSSVQLITGSQCHHWLNLPVFYKEVNRVLVPNGVICFYFYSLPQPAVGDDENKTKALQKLVEHAYRVETIKYWDVRRQVIDKGFEGISDFPFKSIAKENIFSESDITLADYIGYVTSWSAYQDMRREDPHRAQQIIENLETSMKNVMNDVKPINEINIKLHLNYFILMGRK
ncbi:hypothetical protein CHUAL_004302 [Chamberlinius hualienensis]